MAPRREPLTLEDREDISRGLAKGLPNKDIAASLGRDESVVCREIERHGGREAYRAWKADAAARESRKRAKERKIDTEPELRERVAADMKKGWSPEQIAGRLCYERHRGETGMSVSHETIYTWIYAQPKGELARAGIILRTGREQRKPRGRKKTLGAKIVGMRSIEDRPAEAAGRQVPGHWEGDLVIGKQGKSAMGTLVERVSRYLCPVALPHVRRGQGPARPPAQVADLGPGHRAGPARRTHHRRRSSGLFRPRPFPVGARHQREHQRPHQGIPPERDRNTQRHRLSMGGR